MNLKRNYPAELSTFRKAGASIDAPKKGIAAGLSGSTALASRSAWFQLVTIGKRVSLLYWRTRNIPLCLQA
jgi:hypothetical protein